MHLCVKNEMPYNMSMKQIIDNTIESEVLVEQDLSKSKFLSYLAPVQTEDEAKDYLRAIKKIHPKATHHCSAYVVGDIERSNDDGEPASSAGLPMLQVLRGNHLTNVIAVVVRYYGGIKLGVGGLIRAYGSSVTQAIEAATILVPSDVYTMRLSFPYEYTNAVELHIATYATIIDRDYLDVAVYTIELNKPSDMDVLSDYTKGMIVLEVLSHRIDYLKGVAHDT